MALSDVQSMYNQGTILRIKRKRTEDPFNALLIRSSKQRKDNECIPTVDHDKSQSLFWFAGTVEHESTEKVVGEFKKFGWKQVKSNESIKQRARKENQGKHHISRFKLISSRRNQDKLSEKCESDCEKNFEVFDIVSDASSLSIDNSVVEDSDDILCNSVKMIRHNLIIENENTNEIKQTDYVYDLYFAPEEIQRSDNELLDIEFYEDILDANEEIDDDIIDDEDDSNDENNWRNDYPDEEEYNSSIDEEYHTDTSTEEDDACNYGEYRNRRIPMTLYETSDQNEYFETVASSDDDLSG
ncbi:probable RNA polymerase II nuclear localization protein SLC7A6OS isoform X2 [Hydra vulgaris]|uniref:Probable RNA polymerase II nuclear localization protein SLC7A6OS n=1 Tax=Hydra vulgaris TaxID=6087 RepID=A0ABM4C2U7_HYDVU